MRLSETTLHYWRISLAYNRRKEASNISVGRALKFLTQHTEGVTVWKGVYLHMLALRSNIIEGKPAQRKQAK